jgi:HD-like signal output (HDOD) protein
MEMVQVFTESRSTSNNESNRIYMSAEATSKRDAGKYVVLRVRVPGDEPRRAGILVIDDRERVFLRLSETIFSADPDILEVWCGMADELLALADDLGGSHLIGLLQDTASNFLTMEEPVQCEFEDAEAFVNELYQSLVLHPRIGTAGDRYVELGIQRYTQAEVAIAVERLPASPANALKVIKTLNHDDVDFIEIESFLSADPTLASQLVRIANLAYYSRGEGIRTIRQALFQIGTKAAIGFLSALALRPLFSTPKLRASWNEAVICSSQLTELGQLSGIGRNEYELRFLGLIHNIGRIALSQLPNYDRQQESLRDLGFDQLEAETLLCGADHATIGAEVLNGWNFPADIVEATRFHHKPSATSSPEASLLCIVDHWTAISGGSCDLEEQAFALSRLSLTANDLSKLSTRQLPEVDALIFHSSVS